MSTEPISILVVDDHPVVRDGLVGMLSTYADLHVVGTAASGEEALRRATSQRPDVVLLDLQLPGMHGLEVLDRLKTMEHPPRVIVLTVHDDDDLVTRAVRSGADGYVLKQRSLDELVDAVRHVAAGGRRFDEVVVATLVEAREKELQAQAVALTSRELDVLRLVSTGHGNKEVARELHLSAGTVKSYLDDIYRKLEVSDRAHAVAKALRMGLLD
jgi:DNA-binding NarL/FixJ family response regulator